MSASVAGLFVRKSAVLGMGPGAGLFWPVICTSAEADCLDEAEAIVEAGEAVGGPALERLDEVLGTRGLSAFLSPFCFCW